jgi:hypothetical protein
MAFGICFVKETNEFIYIVCTFGIQSEKYGIKKSIANATNVIATYMQILHVTYAILTYFAYLRTSHKYIIIINIMKMKNIEKKINN